MREYFFMATMIESNQTISYDSTTIQIENNTNKSFFHINMATYNHYTLKSSVHDSSQLIRKIMS